MAARTAVVAGTATAVSGRVAQRQQQRYVEAQAAAQPAPAAPAEAPAPAPAPAAAPADAELPDYMVELERLAELKGRGILTEDEFQAKKRQLLGI